MTTTVPVLAPARTPTIDEAHRAADVLAAAGAGQVLLFGSVARGEATPDSDIDLVAIFDDLGDYSDRHQRTTALQAAAEAAVGWDCDVVVTDRPEWAARVEKVSSSFEHAISRESVIMVDNPPGDVDWGKQPVKPMSNPQEALSQLDKRVRPRLAKLETAMFSTSMLEASDPDPSIREKFRLDRMRDVCENSAMTVELSLKTFATLTGKHPVPDKDLRTAGHNIEECLELVPHPYRGRISDLVRMLKLDLASMSKWRVIATYPYNFKVECEQADEWVDDYVRTALTVAQAVAQSIKDRTHRSEASVCLKQIEYISTRFCEHDIRYDRPLDAPDPDKAPAVSAMGLGLIGMFEPPPPTPAPLHRRLRALCP